MKALNTYQKSEEFLNVITHGIGLILSFIALFFLLFKSLKADNNIWLINSLVYGFSLIFLYTSSTFYHASHKPALRNKLNVMDHLAIYILIAGTYTPFYYDNFKWNSRLDNFFNSLVISLNRHHSKNSISSENTIPFLQLLMWLWGGLLWWLFEA